jgi:peptidyl-prolyl cis-trans isomerase A (cyclophilin A)
MKTTTAFLAALALAALPACQKKNNTPGESSGGAPQTGETTASKPATDPNHPRVKFVTSMGEFVVELDREKAPVTVENFLGYVERKHYDGTIIHSAVEGFTIRGGKFRLKNGHPLEKPTGLGIKNEADNGLKNLRGTIAMDRKPAPDSATAWFIVNLKDNEGLDRPNPDGHGYAVFGKVVEGMDVVDAIGAVPTESQQVFTLHPVNGEPTPATAQNVPKKPVVIESAVLLGK